MSPQTPASGINTVAIVGVALLAWYLYQIGSRKQERIRYKIRRTVVALVIYLAAALVLSKQGLPPIEAVVVGVLAGMGCAWLLVKAPKGERRIPTAIRRAVIARDLTSKGLKWDPVKYHIDHIVPFSRGGDNSVRNLRVIEKHKNLRKGGRMPIPLLAALAAAAVGRRTAPKKKAVSGYTKTTKNGKKVKVKAYTKDA